MSTDLIKVGELAEIEVALLPEANKQKNVLLNQARGIEEIEDSFDAECAADALKNLSTAIKDMEKTRKAVKAPVLDLGKRIDAVAKEFAGDLDEQKKRISRLLGDYEAAERRKREEAARAAREAEEAARREAEAAMAQGDDEAAAEAADKIAASKTATAEVGHRPQGTSVRETWKFEVEDIEALFKACPHLCKIEPNNGLIRETIKTNQSIPGLRIWKEATSYAR